MNSGVDPFDVIFRMRESTELDPANPLPQPGAHVPIKYACGFCMAYPCEDGKPHCVKCGEALADGTMAKRWPPPSQEARAASTGQTRTRGASMPKCALCQDERVVNYPGDGRDACPNCSGGSRR